MRFSASTGLPGSLDLSDFFHHHWPSVISVKAMTSITDDKMAKIFSSACIVDPLQIPERSTGRTDWKDGIILARDNHNGLRCKKAHDVGHLCVLEKSGNVVVRTVVD